MSLPANYKDDILNIEQNEHRVYNIIDSEGNVVASNVHLEDITLYTQRGTSLAAKDINDITTKINELESSPKVSSFNTRTGDVTLNSTDVTGALGYTPPQQDTNTSSGITRTPTTHVPGANVEASLVALNKVNLFNIPANAWVTNTDTSTNADYPFVAVITTTDYDADSVPIWQMIGAGTITTKTEEKQCAKILQAYFSATGITLYATEAPTIALKLHVKGV